MNKLIERLKNPQVWGFFVSMAVLAVVSLAFFYPDSIEGNSLQQSDIRQGIANGQEAKIFQESTGEQTLWTNSLFGGMPTFQISPSYPSNSLFTWIDTVYGLGLPAPSNLLFMMMFGFLILLFAMRFRWYYALLGAIAWGLSSYFVIIIGAGHIWKFVALAYIPPTIAGMMLIYRGRYVAGAAMMSLCATMQLNANHPQMSYYFFFVMAALAIAWFVEAYRNKTIKKWLTATAISAGAGILALGANLPSLYNTYEYAKETKRAQSELTPVETVEDVSEHKSTGGMPYDQIVGWSYGRSETFSLLVPNVKGGASARPEGGHMTYLSLDKLPEATQYGNTPAGAMLPYLSQYFNDSEGTNGPVYVGALIVALFILGCFIVRGPMKWAIVSVTLLSVLLSFGRNFETLTDFMIFHFPLYNKFRAVESILVIAEFTMPLLAVMALHKLFTTTDSFKVYRRPIYLSFGFTALICVLALLTPSIFGEAITGADHSVAQNIQAQIQSMAQQYGLNRSQLDAEMYQYSLSNPVNVSAIENLRYGMVKADGLRSLIFIAFGLVAIFFCCKGTIKARVATLIVAGLVLIDLYGVDKRYISHSSFAPNNTSATASYAPTPDALDSEILKDEGLNYRVLDIPGFDLPDRSYFHKMLGGYHAAKLRRYDDLIQRRLRPVLALGYYPELRDDSVSSSYPEAVRDAATNYRVLDMLNTRYIITGDKDYPLAYNEHALGNAWFVDSLVYVEDADAEMAALGKIDPARVAVADRRFSEVIGHGVGQTMPGDSIYLTEYQPNRLTYTATTTNGGLGVFSEIYFPWGWSATIDGQPAEIARVNYLLRAIVIPAGRHEVVMSFDPQSLHTTSAIAYVCISLIYMLCLGGVFISLRRCGVF